MARAIVWRVQRTDVVEIVMVGSLLLKVLLLSRPRFWIYLLGPYLVGVAAAGALFDSWLFWLHAVYFLFIANVMLYGINDIFDVDTDAYSRKKKGKEYRFLLQDKLGVYVVVGLSVLITAAFVVTQPTVHASLFFVAFFVLSVAYSMPPIRLKALPFFDSWSNVLYIMPGFVGYVQFGGRVSWWLFLPLGAWAAAMHLFSAIPDIDADKKANLRTTAVVLGYKWSLVLCGVYWLIFAVGLLGLYSTYPLFALGFVYPIIAFALFLASPAFVDRFYWYFPLINAVLGCVAFLSVF